jgi:hypothetical protein
MGWGGGREPIQTVAKSVVLLLTLVPMTKLIGDGEFSKVDNVVPKIPVVPLFDLHLDDGLLLHFLLHLHLLNL